MWMLQTVDFSPYDVFLLNSEVPFQVSSTGTVWLDQRLHSHNTNLCFKYKEKETWRRVWNYYDGTVSSQGVNQKKPAEILKAGNVRKENVGR